MLRVSKAALDFGEPRSKIAQLEGFARRKHNRTERQTFAWREFARGDSADDPFLGERQVSGTGDRRNVETDAALAERGANSIHHNPECDAIASLGPFNGLSRYCGRLALKQRLDCQSRPITGALGFAGRVARLAGLKSALLFSRCIFNHEQVPSGCGRSCAHHSIEHDPHRSLRRARRPAAKQGQPSGRTARWTSIRFPRFASPDVEEASSIVEGEPHSASDTLAGF
jgi:hypothetical protein